MPGSRLKHWTAILFPVLASLYLYRRSFRIWFLNDDFAWLGLSLGIHSIPDFFTALFAPMAQGTVRTLSERLFFLCFEQSFGLESLPMRLFTFATLACAQVLLVLVIRRLTGSLSTGVIAALLWSLNFGLTTAVNWLSSYNQILLVTLFLAALYSFIEGALVRCWICYLLAFGALETAIVFPAVILLYAALFDREKVRKSLPFFVPAILFTLAHLFLIPKAGTADAYRMHFDSSLFESLAVYWDWLLGAEPLIHFDPAFQWMLNLSHWILTPALLAFLVWRTIVKDYLPLFLCALSLGLIAPMLPLRDHRTDYYLASASVGVLSMLALIPLRLPKWAAVPSVALISIFAVPSFIAQQASIEWYLGRTAPLRPMVRGLQYATRAHPGKLIFVEGITDTQYNSSLADGALRLIPNSAVHLTPGSGPAGNAFAIAPASMRAALEKQTAVVYRFNGAILKDVTREWERSKSALLADGPPPEVLAGDPSFNSQFLSGWYPAEGPNRWMGSRASVRLGIAASPQPVFRLKAFAPAALGPIDLEISTAGKPFFRARILPGPVEISASLPESIRSSSEAVIELRPSRTVTPPDDGRELSLLVTQISIR